MKTIKYICVMLIALISIMGCSGNYGKTHRQSQSDAKATEKELLNNWTEYNVYINRSYWVVRFKRPFEAGAIVFDPKNDDKKILVGTHWKTVKDQKTWTEFAKANTTSDGNFKLTSGRNTPTQTSETTGVLEILRPDNRKYGFFIRQERMDFVYARRVDENTLRVLYQPTGGGSPAK